MREWVDDAVQRVLARRPARVLEIGCGTGLLLFRIAPHCARYFGTDFSPAALNYVREQLRKPDHDLPHVSLSEQNADDFTNIEPASWDAVIINSVVQYFPGVDYLMRVLRGAVEAVAPGGFVFIGDVRSLPLLKALHASVELHKADDACSIEQLRRRVERRSEQEEELLIDPVFFTALRQLMPMIGGVEVEPKRGRYRNELTQFRYQVMIRIGEQKRATADNVSWVDWREVRWDLTELRRRLVQDKPQMLALTNVANARLTGPPRLAEILNLNAEQIAVDPEDLYRLQYELPYQIHLSWARHGADGSFDVVFTRGTTPQVIRFPAEPIINRSLSDYVNHPLESKHARKLGSELRSFLKERLPEHIARCSADRHPR
jgi:SAM-dependent methyltransferase